MGGDRRGSPLETTLLSNWTTRYLNMLACAHEAPGLAALARLCHAQVTRVPFENITSILRRAAVPRGRVPYVDTDVTLEAWEANAAGGVCVDATPTFRRLLLELGYTARPTLAQISFPASHQATVVTLEGADYLVDVANGAPFFEPLPMDHETIIERAGLAWRFRRETPDMLVQDRYINAAWQPFCHYDLRPVDEAGLDAAFQRHHTPGESWVVGNLTLVRSLEDSVLRLRDDELVRHSPAGVVSERIDRADLPNLVAETFGLPNARTADALAALPRINATAAVTGH